MLLQLGSKVFEGLYAPVSISYSGNEANLAEYELINTKPRLQFTGETLEEISIRLQLRIEYCNPAQEIKDFAAWKSSGEVLSFLLGTGEYVGDYVLKSVSKDIVQTFADGAIAEANVTLSLVEYVPGNEEEQRVAEDRRKAAAVGDKKQVVRRPVQPVTPEADAHKALIQAQNEAWNVADAADKAKNADVPEEHISEVQMRIDRAQKSMTEAREKIDTAKEKITNATGVIAAVNGAKDKLTEIGNLMQSPISLTALNNSILNLQTGLGSINDNSVIFTNDVILRKI